MINISISQEAPDSIALFFRGHAEYNPGNDVVCASVSSLVYSLAGYLLNIQNRLKCPPKISMDKGDADIIVSCGIAPVLPCFEMVIIGLLQIEKKYPANVQVKIKGKDLNFWKEIPER